jgi:hypothetical protein
MSTRERFQADLEQTKADAKAQLEKLQTRRAQLRATLATEAGEARARVQTDLDGIDSQIAASKAAIDDPFLDGDEV